MFDYIKDPAEITLQSFEQIEALSDLSAVPDSIKLIALRLIHTSGNLDIVNHLEMTGDIMSSGVSAIKRNQSILCDVEMVKNGISKKFVSTPPLCFLNESDVPSGAKSNKETRTMFALKYWPQYMDGAIVVIGNAPTALFRYLEMLQEGAKPPSLVIGMPVGFVGAQESKQALMEYAINNNIPAIILKGRVGGSALAATTVNAIAGCATNSLSYDGQ